MLWRRRQEGTHVRHIVGRTVITHRCSPLQFKTAVCGSCESHFFFYSDVSPFRDLNSLAGILEDLWDHFVLNEMP